MKESSGGFTLVEVIVTVAVVGIFIAIISQGYTATVSQERSSSRYAILNNVASNNLRKYQLITNLQNSAGASYVCSASTRNESGAFTLLNDASSNKENIPAGNFGEVNQRVIVFSPRDCGESPTVKSIVQYGPATSRETISQATIAR